MKAVETRDKCAQGHVFSATRKERLLAAVCRKTGREGRIRQGVMTEAERTVAWTRCQQRHRIPELSGRGMVRTQSAPEMKEAEEANAPPGLGCLQRSGNDSGDQVGGLPRDV